MLIEPVAAALRTAGVDAPTALPGRSSRQINHERQRHPRGTLQAVGQSNTTDQGSKGTASHVVAVGVGRGDADDGWKGRTFAETHPGEIAGRLAPVSRRGGDRCRRAGGGGHDGPAGGWGPARPRDLPRPWGSDRRVLTGLRDVPRCLARSSVSPCSSWRSWPARPASALRSRPRGARRGSASSWPARCSWAASSSRAQASWSDVSSGGRSLGRPGALPRRLRHTERAGWSCDGSPPRAGANCLILQRASIAGSGLRWESTSPGVRGRSPLARGPASRLR